MDRFFRIFIAAVMTAMFFVQVDKVVAQESSIKFLFACPQFIPAVKINSFTIIKQPDGKFFLSLHWDNIPFSIGSFTRVGYRFAFAKGEASEIFRLKVIGKWENTTEYNFAAVGGISPSFLHFEQGINRLWGVVWGIFREQQSGVYCITSPSFIKREIVFNTAASTPTNLPTATSLPTKTSQPRPTAGSVEPTVVPGSCSLGSGPCSVESLLPYFNNEMIKARNASMICLKESSSNPFVINKGCLTAKTYEYSVGLFQINLLAHSPPEDALPVSFRGKKCKEAFGLHPEIKKCTVIDQKLLDFCVSYYQDVDNNLKKAFELSKGGTNWSKAWKKAAGICGIN